MWICSTDVSRLPGRQALLPVAFLALVVTWWHTVASGVQTGSPRAKWYRAEQSLKTSYNFETLDHEKTEKDKCWLLYPLYILSATCLGFFLAISPFHSKYVAIYSSWYFLKFRVAACTAKTHYQQLWGETFLLLVFLFLVLSPEAITKNISLHGMDPKGKESAVCYWLYNYWEQTVQRKTRISRLRIAT